MDKIYVNPQPLPDSLHHEDFFWRNLSQGLIWGVRIVCVVFIVQYIIRIIYYSLNKDKKSIKKPKIAYPILGVIVLILLLLIDYIYLILAE